MGGRRATRIHSGWDGNRLSSAIWWLCYGVCRLLYPRSPRASLAVASAFGTLRSWGYRPVSPEDLAGLLGETRQRRHDLLVRGLARNHYLDSFLFRLRRRHGIQPLIRVLDISGAEQLEALHRQQQPVILILSHMGPPSGVVAALCHTGLPVLCMAALPLKHSVSDNLRVLAVRSSDADRTVALKSALSELRNGGIVLITVDGMTGKTAREYAILGHRQHLQRGISVLQRLGKATVMPVSTSWRRLGRVEVAFEAPLVETSETDSEEAVQELLVSWFESHIRDHADQIRADRLRVWLDDANPPAAR